MYLLQPTAKFISAPMMWAAAAFAVGIAAARVAAPSHWLPVVIMAVGVAAAVVFKGKRASSAALLVCLAALGALCYQFETAPDAPDRLRMLLDNGSIPADTPIEIEGRLIDGPESAHNGVFVTIETDRASYRNTAREISGRVRIFIQTTTETSAGDLANIGLRYGSRIRTFCVPTRDGRYMNPGVMPRPEILRMQGVDASATVKSPLMIENLSDENEFAPLSILFEYRRGLIERFREHFSASTAGVMIASLLGNKHFLDRQTSDVFREGGTFHILVISGLHITFIGGIALLLVRIFTNDRRWQFFASCSFLWLYTIAVGAETPVVRASIMFTVLMTSYVLYRQSAMVNSLGVCCFLLLAIRPSELFDPSFQLTVVSVGAIVGMAFPLIKKMRAVGEWMPSAAEPFPPNVPRRFAAFCEKLYWRQRVWDINLSREIWSATIRRPVSSEPERDGRRRLFAYVVEGFLVSAIVQFWLLPFLVFYFHRFTPSAVFFNIWAGFAIAVESFAALAGIAFASVSTNLAAPFIFIAEAANWVLVAVPGFLTQNGFGSIRMPVYSGAMRSIYFAYFIPVAVLTAALHRWDPFALQMPRRRSVTVVTVSSFAVAVFAAVVLFHPFSAPRPDGLLHVEFLDVGQGDAAFVTFPNGETMLIDAGGRFDFGEETSGVEADIPRIGEAVVSEFIWEKGISRIDMIVATHADADHVRGLVDVAKNFDIGRAVVDRSAKDDEAAELFAVLEKENIPVAEPAGKFDIDGVSVEFLYPDAAVPVSFSDNDRSVVLKITYGKRVFLFTGDIEKAAEERLLALGHSLSADVVKVPHHGSRTSSTQEFIDAAEPKFAVIPVGKRSIFGHPHAEVVERWKLSGANVMRTGITGTIRFTTDGEFLLVDVFNKKVLNCVKHKEKTP